MEKKKALEKMYNKIVDVIYKTFTRKSYFVKMSQSQKDTWCTLLSGRRGEGYWVKKKMCSTKKSSTSRKVF